MNIKKMSNDDQADKLAMLFEECVEISDSEKRIAYLKSACADNPELREEVESLLQAHEESGHFMEGGLPPQALGSGDSANGDLSDLKPGDTVGPYRLLGCIGEGGTSTVYLAEQEKPVRRWVALKIIKPGMDTKQVILRFSLERQALALMDHPGIAKLLDAGATPNGRPFFVMELVSGVGITDYCDQHRLTIHDRLSLFIEVCDAVFHAHQRGIIHRDLKPENILVTESQGRRALKIVDFGIAKVLNSWGVENATRTGLPILGTPAYMSPEQIQMSSPELDTRTDIYSLGALLYEMLTGHPPFDAKELMEAGLEGMFEIIRMKEPAAPSERFFRLSSVEQCVTAEARGTTPNDLRRMLTGDLDWITLKALEKQRDRRYATTEGLARDIHRHFEHLPVSAAAPSLRYRLAKLVQRKRKLVIAGSAAAAALLISTCLIFAMAINARISATQARNSEKAATLAERESHKAMVSMHVSSGLADADDRHPDKAVLWFAKAAQLAGPMDLQAEVNKRRAMCWMNRVPIPVGSLKLDSTFRNLEFSNDSRYLLALARDGSWEIWDSVIQENLPWTEEIGNLSAAAWSPTNSLLAVSLIAGEVRVYDVREETLLHSFSISPAPGSIGFTPDAQYLVAGNSSLHVFNLSGQDSPRQFPLQSQAFVGFAFSENSNRIVGVTNGDLARIIDAETSLTPPGSRYVEFPHRHAIRTEACPSKSSYREDFLETARLSLPAFYENEGRIITRTGPYSLTYWDLETGDPFMRLNDICCSCKFITDSKSGLMACGIQGGKVGIWDIKTGIQKQLLPSQGACILDMAFGRGGKSLITAEANGMARIWAVDQATEIQCPMHHCTDVDIVTFSKDGKMVATGQSDGLLRVWNVLEMQPDEHDLLKVNVPTFASIDRSGTRFVLTKEPGWDASINKVTVLTIAGTEIKSESIEFSSGVETAVFSADSKRLAVGVDSPDGNSPGKLVFYDLVTRQTKGLPIDLPSDPSSISWNPANEDVAVICESGELLVIQQGPEVGIRWSVPFVSPPSRKNPTVAYSGNGNSLISMGPDGTIQVRESLTGQLRYPPLESSPDGYWSFSLLDDSRHMATSTISGQVNIWDLETGFKVGNEMLHPSWVYRCRFSPDMKTLATASHDGKVRLWDWQTGVLLSDLLTHPSEVFDVTFTPDSRWIMTACRDGNLRIWDPQSAKVLSPPIKVGAQAFNIEISSNGHFAAVGVLGNEGCILSLDILHEDLPYDTSDFSLIGEVVSSCTIENGAIRDLTTNEWINRYEKLRKLHPEALYIGSSYGIEKINPGKSDKTPKVDLTKNPIISFCEDNNCPKDCDECIQNL